MAEDFVVLKVAWLTRKEGLEDVRERMRRHFLTLFTFLQEHGLVRDAIVGAKEGMDDETELRSGQLTPEGLEFMRVGYARWSDHLDRGGDPSDDGFLRRQLKKMRGGG